MGEKPVTDLSGIGEVLGKKLEDQGFDKVRALRIRPNNEVFVLSTSVLFHFDVFVYGRLTWFSVNTCC